MATIGYRQPRVDTERGARREESERGKTVVHEEMCAIHETRFVRRKKERGGGHFGRFAESALLLRDRVFRHIDAHRAQLIDFANSVRRANEARRDGVAADAALAIFDRERAREHMAGALGGVVQHFAGRRAHGGNRRRANDRTRRFFQHLRQDRLRHQIHAFDVHGHEPVPFVFFDIEERFDDQRARVIEQHVGGAEGFARGGNGTRDVLFARDIGAKTGGAQTFVAQYRGERFGGVAVTVDDRDARTLPREQRRSGRAASSRTATDDGDLAGEPAVESSVHDSLSCVAWRMSAPRASRRDRSKAARRAHRRLDFG
ncbi:hypothetical protein PT2222_370064 [Paraburkholderia tropica]